LADLARKLQDDGFVVFDADAHVVRWARAAHDVARSATADPAEQDKWLRHGKTWFVGVDALPNDDAGAVDGVPLRGPWDEWITPPAEWHPAQISVMYPQYPLQDEGESDAAHRFRVRRDAAHVDGLHLEDGRRIVREPHAFILGLPLNQSRACPLVVWRGSHAAVRAAFQTALAQADPLGADVTDIYKATRAEILETCDRVEIAMGPGQAVLVDRFALHGVAPWKAGDVMPPEGRMVAYFRPQFSDARDWLKPQR
jgi:hypothetical protein